MSELKGLSPHDGDGLVPSESCLALLDIGDPPDERSKHNKDDDSDASKADCGLINPDVHLVNLVSLIKTKRIQGEFQLSAYPGVVACDSSTAHNLNTNPDVNGSSESFAHISVTTPNLPFPA